MTAKNEMNVETKERELIVTREFDAPRELVFKAYSSCEHLKNWWGTHSWPIDECSIEFKEGGTWHYCLRGPNDGDESWGKSIFQEINEPELIVYKDFFSDKDGNINKEIPGMLITIELHKQGNKTKMVSNTLFDSPEVLQQTVEMGVVEGFGETWDRLEEYVTSVEETEK